MKTKILKAGVLPQKATIALLFGELDNLPVDLTPEETDFWKSKPEDADNVLIQRLPHSLFLVNPKSGKSPHLMLEAFRKAGAAWFGMVKTSRPEKLCISGENTGYTISFLEGFLLAGYTFSKYKKKKEDYLPEEIFVIQDNISQDQLDELTKILVSVYWARNLVNEPLSYLTAIKLAEEFLNSGESSGFSVEVFNRQKIEVLKMGGLLAVNKGSIDPPTFSVLEWKPEAAVNQKPIVLIGKGVVFDTGGLSLKPTPKSMDYMKCDMAGGAAIAAVIKAASLNKLPVYIIGLIPATDNRPDGNAFVPGDIITLFDGTTVEVMNTDAEGRLLLADALSYAKRYDPELVIDVATLTGAASIIAGNQGVIAMGNAPEQIQKLKTAGDEVYERIVELPLWEEFGLTLKSDAADMANLGGREGQTIIAGKFLEHFTGYPWIHLDIAGTAWNFENDGWKPKGGTASGVRLLYNFLKKF